MPLHHDRTGNAVDLVQMIADHGAVVRPSRVDPKPGGGEMRIPPAETKTEDRDLAIASRARFQIRDQVFDIEHSLIGVERLIARERLFHVGGGTRHDTPEDIGDRHQKPVPRPGVGLCLHLVVDAENRGNQENTRRLSVAIRGGQITGEILASAGRVGNVRAWHCRLQILNRSELLMCFQYLTRPVRVGHQRFPSASSGALGVKPSTSIPEKFSRTRSGTGRTSSFLSHSRNKWRLRSGSGHSS